MNAEFSHKGDKGFAGKCRRGFTLMEVLVSLAVIAIVLVSIIRLQGQTILMNQSFRFYTISPLLAQAKLSEAIEDPSGMDMASSGDFGEDYPGYTWQINTADIQIPLDEDTTLDLKQIDVTIRFNKGEIQYTFRRFTGADSEI